MSALLRPVRECVCVGGTCVLCALALPLFAVVGLFLYAGMLAGFGLGTGWGVARALGGTRA